MPRQINVQEFILALLVQRRMDNIQTLTEHNNRHTVEQEQDLTYCVQGDEKHTIDTTFYINNIEKSLH